MFAYDFPERDRRRVVAGRRERSSRWRWHCPHRNLHLCHCRMQSTEMADKGLLSTILGMPRSTCAAAQIIRRGVKTIAKYARLSSSFTSSSTPSAHVTLGHTNMLGVKIKPNKMVRWSCLLVAHNHVLCVFHFGAV